MRRSEWILIATGIAAVAGAGLLGILHAPGEARDHRHTVRSAGPGGLQALPTVLRRLGVPNAERTVALFDLGHSAPSGDTVLALFQPPSHPTSEEIRALHAWVRRGGRLVLAGWTGVAGCFGYDVETLGGPAIQPLGGGLPPLKIPAAALRRIDEKRDADGDGGRRSRLCAPMVPVAHRVLLAEGKDTIAIRQTFAGGGEVMLVADVQLFTNRGLKEHPLGVDAVGWLLDLRPGVLTFDEYHQGFGERASLFGASWDYLRTTPAGWTLLQLALAGLILLGIAAVRFGPPVPVVERRRRQPLEHLDALASGLERGRAVTHARQLLALGLRRRLNPLAPPRESRVGPWLAALERGARGDAARSAVNRLRRSLDAPGDGADILKAASLVEDVWDTLKAPSSRSRS